MQSVTRSRDILQLALKLELMPVMASGLVRAGLDSIVSDSVFAGLLERSQKALMQVKNMIEISSDPAYLDNFDQFAIELISALETTFRRSKSNVRSSSVAREKLWTGFHSARVTVLVDIWGKFSRSLGLCVDPLIQQYLNQKLYEDIIRSNHITQPRTCKKTSLSASEENIVRYAAGYVPMVLMRRHEKSSSEKSVSFVECLSSMAVDGEDSTLLEYTTNWISTINRGGLFEVNDMTYLLFREIEDNIRDKLKCRLQPFSSNCQDKEEIISSAIDDENIQFYWTLLSTDIDDEQDSITLLRELIALWLTIRGHSIAGQWLEVYKNTQSKTTKKSKSLRKNLKQGVTRTE